MSASGRTFCRENVSINMFFFCIMMGTLCFEVTQFAANKYMFKVNNRNTKKWCEICSKLTIKTPDVNDIVLVSLILTLNIFHTFLWCFYCCLLTVKSYTFTLSPSRAIVVVIRQSYVLIDV